ncbi:hypothetical protein ESCNG_120026 [Neisseria gonorrhoeae]|uniref:Uncharacterized protein n=1 Tax=Neisseria gonorrhoeae TaxID=485 RepID=A0AB74ENR2_NEIGO|nr:hypothetical protein ESCNG_120026 [Neisseria gonorrhoeae]SCW10187.1 hypothetical protein ESCNG_180005 [Neisseria gonorrhoeae]
MGRILESDISAKRGCRIQVSDLLFSDGLSDNSSNSTQRAVGLPEMLGHDPTYAYWGNGIEV